MNQPDQAEEAHGLAANRVEAALSGITLTDSMGMDVERLERLLKALRPTLLGELKRAADEAIEALTSGTSLYPSSEQLRNEAHQAKVARERRALAEADNLRVRLAIAQETAARSDAGVAELWAEVGRLTEALREETKRAWRIDEDREHLERRLTEERATALREKREAEEGRKVLEAALDNLQRLGAEGC